MSPSEQEKALANGEIDLALLGAASPSIKRRYKSRAIRQAHMAAIVPQDHPLASRTAIDLAELADDTFISLHEKHFPSRPLIMARLFERARIQPEVAVHAAGLTELLGLVSAGWRSSPLNAPPSNSLPRPSGARRIPPTRSLIWSTCSKPPDNSEASRRFFQPSSHIPQPPQDMRNL